MNEPAFDAIVVGAGIVGAACAHAISATGLRVAVVERGPIAAGTSSAGEGNVLVSDKAPGPELDLALLSLRLWHELCDDLGGSAFEFEPKGGVVVARSPASADGLRGLTGEQRRAGVEAEDVSADALLRLEPNLSPDVAAGAWYPQDAQVQPILSTAALLRGARQRGAVVLRHTTVTGFLRGADGPVAGVTTSAPGSPRLSAPWVVNAAGTWAGDVAALAGSRVPVLPRRGFILVTEPVPRLVRHKVYSADYVANVSSDAEDLQTSVVVEGTRAGTILIGASRERVGFDRTVSTAILRRLASQAIGLFPVLAEVAVMRSYLGFRPYCPDHLPVIGQDPDAPGLVHACGHEGAGIGLAPATGRLVADIVTGRVPAIDLAPFRPDRFAAVPT